MKVEKLAELLLQASNLQNYAYVPYSNFRVAAIVSLKNGQNIFGVNVENAAYSTTICAERAALSQVIAQGFTINDIESLFLITDSNNIGSPCGECRQVITELMGQECYLYIANKNTKFVKQLIKIKVKELLPIAFNAFNLKKEK